MTENTVREILEAEMSGKEFIPRKLNDRRSKVFGDDLKGALLDAIVTSQIGTNFWKGMCPTILDDLFVPGRNVHSKKSARVLIRMMQLHKQDWWSVKKLRASMCSYASFLEEEGTDLSPRKAMVDWAMRMLEMLYRLSFMDHLSSAAVKICIAKAMAFGGPRREKYCFGNASIKSQLAIFVERLSARKAMQVCNTFFKFLVLVMVLVLVLDIVFLFLVFFNGNL